MTEVDCIIKQEQQSKNKCYLGLGNILAVLENHLSKRTGLNVKL